jgi:hypothetical protein
MKFIFCIFICLIFNACSNSKVPYGIIEPKDMENILWEQMKADAFTKEFVSKNTSLDLVKENYNIQQKIFTKYKIDKEDFYESYQYYLAHDDMFKMILDSLITKQTRIRDNNRMIGFGVNQYQNDLTIRFAMKGFISPSIMQDTMPLFYPIHKSLRTSKHIDLLKRAYE